MIEFLYVLKNILVVLLALTPFIAYGIKYRFKFNAVYAYLSACVICYLLIVITSSVTDSYLEAILQTYDLDGNDFFDENELTIDAKVAMDKVTNDTGRKMAIFTGLIISPILAGIGFGISFLAEWAINFLFKNHESQ